MLLGFTDYEAHLDAIHRVAVAALDREHNPGGLSIRALREAMLTIARATDDRQHRLPTAYVKSKP